MPVDVFHLKFQYKNRQFFLKIQCKDRDFFQKIQVKIDFFIFCKTIDRG